MFLPLKKLLFCVIMNIMIISYIERKYLMKAHISKSNYFDGESDNDFEEDHNPYLRQTVLEVVDNQLRENNPPMTKITLERLIKAGYTELQAKEKIAAVVLVHVYEIMKHQVPFDEEQYIKDLSELE